MEALSVQTVAWEGNFLFRSLGTQLDDGGRHSTLRGKLYSMGWEGFHQFVAFDVQNNGGCLLIQERTATSAWRKMECMLIMLK
jgi:hypothetical protein